MEESTIEACAIAAHLVNNAYCAAVGDPPSPPWALLTDAQRNGVRSGVRGAIAGESPAQSHANWLQTRVAEGWTFGATKDFTARTSPCLLPYDQLPEAQRRKDALFQAVARAMAEALAGPAVAPTR